MPSRTKRRKTKEQRRQDSIQWAAYYHDQFVMHGFELGFARAFMKYRWGMIEITTKEDRRYVEYHNKNELKLASLSEAVLTRLKGELLILTSPELSAALAGAVKFWDKRRGNA